MKKNVASQIIGAQMISAVDGSEFTGSVTVYVTGDGGTQAIGSVGSGACAHEGHGYHTYTPAQTETNYDLVAFTFVGTGAVAATVQVYTTFPQTGDSYGRIGAPAGASMAADVLSIQTDTNDIQTRLPSALVSGRLDASVGAMAANVMTAAAAATDLTTELQSGLATAAAVTSVASDLTTVKAKTDNLPTDPADQSLIIAATDAVMSRLGAPAGASVSADIAAVKTDSSAVKAKTDNLPTDPADQSLVIAASDAIFARLGAPVGASIAADIATVPTAVENADVLLTRDWTSVVGEAGRSVLNALRFVRNRWYMSGTTLTVTKENDSSPAWTAEVSTTPGADPITGTDPS